jgi:hypothetical protein
MSLAVSAACDTEEFRLGQRSEKVNRPLSRSSREKATQYCPFLQVRPWAADRKKKNCPKAGPYPQVELNLVGRYPAPAFWHPSSNHEK